jgi:rhodanese-related sulfurtransferase
MNFFTKLFSGASISAVSPSEAQKKLSQKPKPFLLDVRQPEEFRTGHVPGAKLIPLGELSSRMEELPKNQEILVICRSGNRSMSATRQLTHAGYNAVNINGGILAWSQAGFSVSKGK